MRNGNLGKKVFDRFERKLDQEGKSSFDLYSVETAADLVLQSPYVTHHLIERGIIKRGEHTRLLPVWNANLASQLYGAKSSKGYKITTETAHKRASTLTGYTLRNFPKVTEMIKSRKKSEYDLYYGLRDAALVESLQCDYISGIQLTKQAETAAAIALIRRLSSEIPRFRDFLITLDVDTRDLHALRQFSEEADTRGYLHGFYKGSLFFQRRDGIIVSKLTITDSSDNVIALSRTKEPIFTEGKIAHAVDKLGLNIYRIFAKMTNRKAQ